MGPKKNDDKVAEQIHRDDDRIVAVESKLSAVEERLNEMMKFIASGFERIELRKEDQTEGRDRRGEGLIPSGLNSNPAGASKPMVLQGEGSGKQILEEPRSISGVRSTVASGLGAGSVNTQPSYRSILGGKEEWLPKRMEIPTFDGEESENWVLRVEQYFELGDFTEEEKLRAVRMCFIGDALPWYRWERSRNPFLSWEQMKTRVLEQFSAVRDTSAGERILCLRQTGTVRSFRSEFIALASNAPEIPDPILEMAFMNGLKPKIKAGVKMMSVRGLEKVMDAAKLVEDWSEGGETAEETAETPSKTGRVTSNRHQAQTNKPAQSTGQSPNLNKGRSTTNATTASSNTQTKPNHNRLKAPFRRLTPAEVAKWKAEGLCYRCDEKYIYPHRCAQPEVVVLMVLEDGTEIDVSNCSVELEEEEIAKEVEVAAISISSIVGISSTRTIKLKGKLMGKEVVVLIDSGATHNFVSKELVTQLKLQTDRTRGYSVMTAGGVTFKGAGLCSELELELQGCTITSSFLPLELGSADIILGIQWLETLGNMKVNWKLQILRFKWERISMSYKETPASVVQRHL